MLSIAFFICTCIIPPPVFAIGEIVDQTAFWEQFDSLQAVFSINDTEDSDWGVSQVTYEGSPFLLMAKNRGDSLLEPKSVLPLDLPENHHIAYRHCSVNEKPDIEVIGVFERSHDFILQDPLYAIRADRDEETIRYIGTDGISCENPYHIHKD